MFIPKELWDKILIKTNDLRLAILYKNDYVIKKLYNPSQHTYFWCILNKDMVVFDFLIKKETCQQKFKMIFVDSIWFNNFEIAEYLIERIGYLDQDLIEECFLYKTNLETILFFEKRVQFSQYILDEICGNCDLKTLHYLIDKKYTFTEMGIVNVVINGNIENLDILMSQKTWGEFTFYLMDIACENLRWDMMRHLYKKYNILGSNLIFEKAIMTRSKKIIQWVYDSHNIHQITSFGYMLLSSYFTNEEILEMGF